MVLTMQCNMDLTSTSRKHFVRSKFLRCSMRLMFMNPLKWNLLNLHKYSGTRPQLKTKPSHQTLAADENTYASSLYSTMKWYCWAETQRSDSIQLVYLLPMCSRLYRSTELRLGPSSCVSGEGYKSVWLQRLQWAILKYHKSNWFSPTDLMWILCMVERKPHRLAVYSPISKNNWITNICGSKPIDWLLTRQFLNIQWVPYL